ncbi:2743_t:CDS:1, partial [Cetraspora pellucida]
EQHCYYLSEHVHALWPFRLQIPQFHLMLALSSELLDSTFCYNRILDM